MKRANPLAWNTNQVVTMIEKGTIVFDNPFQRPSGQWKVLNQSLLIHSLLTMFIPDVYAIREKRIIEEKELNVYDVIDGRQRLTTIHEFKKDKFKLSNLPVFELESTGEEYDISGLKYSELPKEVKDTIDSYCITIRPIELEEDDDKEEIVAEIFYRLNNGVKVSNSHLAIVAAKPETRNFVQDTVKNHPLYTTTAHFAVGSIKNSEPQTTVFQSLALVGGYDYSAFGANDLKKIFIETDVDKEIIEKTAKAFDFLHETFSEYNKFVTKVFIPAAVALIVNNNFDLKLISFLKWYAENNKRGDDYRQYSSGGTTKKTSVEGRIKGLQKIYDGFEG